MTEKTKVALLSMVAVAAMVSGAFALAGFDGTNEPAIQDTNRTSDRQSLIYGSSPSGEPSIGNTTLTLSRLPNLGQTATLTVVQTELYDEQYNIGDVIPLYIAITSGLEFVDVIPHVTDHLGIAMYKQNVTSTDGKTVSLSAKIRAVSEGDATLDGGHYMSNFTPSYIRLHISENSTLGHVKVESLPSDWGLIEKDTGPPIITEEQYQAAKERERLREQQNGNTTDTVTSGVNSAPSTSFVQISGTLRVQMEDSTYQDVADTRACLWEFDESTKKTKKLNISGTRTHICTHTDSNGIYTFNSMPNTDPDNSSSMLDIVIKFHTSGAHSSILNKTSFPYSGDSLMVTNIPDGSVTINTTVTSADPQFQGALWIKDALSDGRSFFKGLGDNIQRVNVYWQHDEKTPNGGAYYQRNNDVIYLDGTTSRDDGNQDERWTILHEYGHHVTHTQDTQWNGSNCNGTHAMSQPNTLSCAWGEGWADIIPSLVDNTSLYLIEHNGLFSYDFENHLVVFTSGGTTQFAPHPTNNPAANGELVEGRVASAIWDVHDNSMTSADGGQDSLSEPASRIWAAFKGGNINSFEDWVGHWNSDSSNPSVDDILRLHEMSFAPAVVTPTVTPTNAIFSENFEGTLSKWTLVADDDDDWEIITKQRAGTPSSNKIAHTQNCDKNCYMTTSGTIDTSKGSTELSFYRFISTSIDRGEGLKVEVSANNGRTWTELAFYSADNNHDDSKWHKEMLDLSAYSSAQMKVRFHAISSSNSEHVDVDDVVISSKATGSSSLSSFAFSEPFDSLSAWTKSGDDRWNTVSSWNEDNPSGAGNMFASASNCDNTCTLTLTNPVDISSLTVATLEVSRFVDRTLDRGEYLGMDVPDGSRWVTVATWGHSNGKDTDIWETESINITPYTNAQFKVRINAQMSSSSEDVGIDYIRVSGS